MKKDVLIDIKGIYRQDGEQDQVELVTTGSYYKRNGDYYIAYDESEMTGFDGTPGRRFPAGDPLPLGQHQEPAHH